MQSSARVSASAGASVGTRAETEHADKPDRAYVPVDGGHQRPVVVIGAGTLGRRIAGTLAGYGQRVHLCDVQPSSLRAGAEEANAIRARLSAGPGRAGGEIVAFSDLPAAVVDTWLVIEAVPERLELKQELFSELDERVPPPAILASNSSSFRTSQMLNEVSRPERVLNTHFYQPPDLNAVELMSSGHTDPAIISQLAAYFAAHGLRPFHVQQESTGFIYNRVWAAIKREALMVVAEGVGTPADVDALFCATHGATLGPFALMDRVGLDVVLDIEEHYAVEREHLPTSPRTLLREYIAAGRLGVKSGEGFYRYDANGQRID